MLRAREEGERALGAERGRGSVAVGQGRIGDIVARVRMRRSSKAMPAARIDPAQSSSEPLVVGERLGEMRLERPARLRG